jgi:uncharacterized protein with GYD domain
MPQYIVLANWTEQGIRQVKETVQRGEQFKQLVQQAGGTVHGLFWTQGRYDVAARLEVADDETMTTIALRLGMSGNVRTETLRAFTADEMQSILAKLG